MSHELRTPLNAVIGFSDLLTDERYGPLNDRQRRYAESPFQIGGKHLLTLINDISGSVQDRGGPPPAGDY